ARFRGTGADPRLPGHGLQVAASGPTGPDVRPATPAPRGHRGRARAGRPRARALHRALPGRGRPPARLPRRPPGAREARRGTLRAGRPRAPRRGPRRGDPGRRARRGRTRVSLAPARAAEIDAWLAEARAWTDRELDRLLPAPEAEPRRVHEAMRYAVFGGG